MTRPYPWKCRSCGKPSLSPTVVDYPAEMEHDGRAYSFVVPQLEILECSSCHNRVLPDEALARVTGELRSQAGLLAPQEIRDRRKSLSLTQEQLANYLKVAKETVSRWETGGQIQQRAMDLLLRLFFDLWEVRAWLQAHAAPEAVRGLGATVVAAPPLLGPNDLEDRQLPAPSPAAPTAPPAVNQP